MKIFICLPEEIYSSSEEEGISGVKQEFADCLKKYYGKINVDILGQKNISEITVYIMGEPKYGGFERNIQKECVRLLQSKYNEKALNAQIKLNYANFAPDFNPKNECSFNNSEFKKETKEIKEKKNATHNASGEFDYEKLSYNYQAEEPRYSFDQVILPEYTRKQIEEAIGIMEVEHKVFDEWGLRSIIPEATSALSFYGPPGTGKSMSAEAVAQKLGKKILRATYADIESKFHGEGPKMVKAIFKAAERDDAVLFLDESDSLLSKRLTNVSDGSAQAINSMRSQLLISLEQFKGIVIFATNLVVNYDKAFLSRLINVEFTFPTEKEREKIWWNHLKSEHIHIPLGNDIDIEKIAKDYELCGREIKNTVKNACVSVALSKRDIVMQKDIVEACEETVNERKKVNLAKDQTDMRSSSADAASKEKLKEALQKKLDEQGA